MDNMWYPFKKTIEKKIQSDSKAISDFNVQKSVQKIKNQLGYSYNYGSSSAGGKWPYSISGSGAGKVIDHRQLRTNARVAYQESTQAKALVDRSSDTIADVGLMLECTPKFNILGISQEDAEKWGQDIEARFDLWAGSKKQHRAENINWYQSQRLYQIFQHRDNDIFTRLFYSPDRSLLNPLQFSFIDSDQIRGDAFTTTYGYNNYFDGIERDSRGRESAYKIWYQDPKTGEVKSVDIKKTGPKSKRVFMLHGFVPEYANQTRGYSRLGHIIQEFQNITDFTQAQIKKAINQSNITMYVKPSDDAPASNPLESVMTERGAGPAAVQFGSDPVPGPDAVNITSESLCPVDCYSIPEATIDTPGSTAVFNLNSGEDLRPFENKAPVQNYDSFVDAFVSYLSASVGMPVEVLLMKFNQNYSASRGALILYWRVANIWRQEMATDYLNPVVEMWMSEEIGAGRVSAPGWQDPVLKAAWLSCKWIGSPMPNIDPQKTAKADQLYAELGAHDLDRVARNHNGSSGPANRAKLKRQYQELETPPWKKKESTNG